jgi:hypothetical protein
VILSLPSVHSRPGATQAYLRQLVVSSPPQTTSSVLPYEATSSHISMAVRAVLGTWADKLLQPPTAPP